MRRRRKVRPFFSVSFRFVLLICAAMLLLCYLAPFVNTEHFSLFGVFGVYFLPVVFLNIILLVIALIRQSHSVWIPFVALLPSLFFAEHYLKIGSGEEVVPEDRGVRFMTYNVGRFQTEKSSFKEIIDFIREQDPDIVALQEFSIADTSRIDSLFPQYRYRQKFFLTYKNGKYFVGNMTMSRYPMTGGGKIRFRNSTNMAIFSDLAVAGRQVRVYNLHLESNSISISALKRRMKDNYEEIPSELAGAHEKVRRSSSKRTGQVRDIIFHVSRSGRDAVLCGDFNDTPMSYSFRELGRGRKDTFREKGRGFGATYSVMWPLLRIDYVFVPENCEVLSHETPKVNYSDHYPVVTILDFNGYGKSEEKRN